MRVLQQWHHYTGQMRPELCRKIDSQSTDAPVPPGVWGWSRTEDVQASHRPRQVPCQGAGGAADMQLVPVTRCGPQQQREPLICGFNGISDEPLLVAELLPAVMMYCLEVSSKISSTAVRAGWKSATPGQLNSAPEGGQVPVAA